MRRILPPIFIIALSMVLALSAALHRELQLVRAPLPEAPRPDQPVVPRLMYAPFTGRSALLAMVDHHHPAVAGAPDRVMVRSDGRIGFNAPLDGSTMNRWSLPTGTEVRAPFSGQAIAVERTEGWRCGDRDDGAWVVTLRSCAEDPCLDLVLSPLHAPRIAEGDPVVANQPVATAGIPGCEAPDTLGLMVVHVPSGALLDPYGWQAAGSSPLARQAGRIADAWLWQAGAAPPRQVDP